MQYPSFKKNETLRAHVLRHSENYFVFLIPCVTWGGRGRWARPERIQNESLSELKHTPERIQNQSLSSKRAPGGVPTAAPAAAPSATAKIKKIQGLTFLL